MLWCERWSQKSLPDPFFYFPARVRNFFPCENVCFCLISSKNNTFHACVFSMSVANLFSEYYILCMFFLYVRVRFYYCVILQYQRDNTWGRISTQLVLASQVRLALAFSFCGLSMFLLRLLSVFTSGHRFETACLNSLSKQLF